MGKIVFVLGAGASAHSGAPLMNNFIDKARELYSTNQIDDEYKKDFERVFKAISDLQRVHSKASLDIYNIESVFSAFEMGKIIGKLPGIKDSAAIEELIKSTKKLIKVTLEKSIKYKTQQGDIIPSGTNTNFIKLVLKLADGGKKTSIITFNYDIALEYAFHWMKIKEPQYSQLLFDYCLEHEKTPNAIPFLKLHGSLNWYFCEKCKKFSFYNFSDLQLLAMHQKEGIIQCKSTNLCCNNIYEDPYIVPPTWNKSEQYSGITAVWKRAAQELSEAEIIVVIGYSLPPTDQFFRFLYALGSEGESIIKKFIVFDPCKDIVIVESRFRDLLGEGTKSRFEMNNIAFEYSVAPAFEKSLWKFFEKS